jgi:WD40 repeat protein
MAATAHVSKAQPLTNPQPELRLTIKTNFEAVNAAAFSPDGKRVAAISGGGYGPHGEIGIWDAETGKRLLTIETEKHLHALAFHPDGKHIATGGDGGVLKHWDAMTGKLVKTLKGHGGTIRSAEFSPDGKRVVAGSTGPSPVNAGKNLKVWDVITGDEVFDLKGHAGTVICVRFSGDGKRLASSSYQNDVSIRVWDMQTGKELLSVKRDEKIHPGVTCLAFDREGKRLASGGRGQPVRLWDAETGKELHTLGKQPLASMKFSPDGKSLLGGVNTGGDSDSGWIVIWDVGTRKELLAFRGYPTRLNCLDVTSDGRRIVCGGDITVKRASLNIWSLESPR